jgi:sporulation protein YlmC with PRC-barrel domain
MTELRAGAHVNGPDGDLGTVEALVIDPTTSRITNLVIGRGRFVPRSLVGVEHVRSATPTEVEIDLDGRWLDACPAFDAPDYNEADPGYALATLGYEPGVLFLEPYASPLDGWTLGQHERIPKGEITIRRGDEVVAEDGVAVGQVDEFLVDPADGHLTHVVLREGGLFKRRDVVVPLGGARFEEGRVVLRLGVDELDQLERIPVRRHGHVTAPLGDA